MQIQHENQKISSKYNMTSNASEKVMESPPNDSSFSNVQPVKPYRSEVNLMLCFDGSNPKIIPIENEAKDTTLVTPKKQDTPPPSLPKPMNLLPSTLPYIASDTVVPASDVKFFERFTEMKDCNYLETIRRKIFPKKTIAAKEGADKLATRKVKLGSSNGSENTVFSNFFFFQ